MSKWKIIFHQEKCIGCSACQVACKDFYHLKSGEYFRRADTVFYERMNGGKYAHISGSCNHCVNAACVKNCRTGAMHTAADGTVAVDAERCIGCGICVEKCPFGAVFIRKKTGKAAKCEGCSEQRNQGKLPVCVEACPVQGLQYVEIKSEEMDHDGTDLMIKKELIKFQVNPKMERENKEKDKSKVRVTDKLPFSLTFHMLTAFFSAREQAMCICKKLSDWPVHTLRDWQLEYDFLFRGTDADWQIPLWASAAMGEQVLLNQMTLEIIQFYHKYGYEPIRIEGNPPDYIGEQFRFLQYLSDTDSAEVGNDFIAKYTLPTTRMICDQVLERGTFDGFINLLCQCVEYLETVRLRNTDCPGKPPIPDESPYTVNTAGINNCGGACVIRPEVQEGCLLNISTDYHNEDGELRPLLKACVRGRGYRKTFLNPGRLRYPMKRIGERGSGRFERISWEEAVALIAEKWIKIRDTYGPGARYVNYGFGVDGIMLPGQLAKRLLALDGGYLDYFNSYSSACVRYVTPYIFGTYECANSPQDMLNTNLLILWGDNPTETIFGTERNHYLAQVKAKGIKAIVIDPRLSQTAVAYADQWVGIRPASDSALADAMAYVIWSEGLQNQTFMDTYCLGFDEEHMPDGIPAGESYHSYLFGMKDGVLKTPEWASEITGIEPEIIRELAREYALAKPGCIVMGLGPQRHGNGEQTSRGICMLACLTGNVGIPGGSAIGQGFISEHVKIGLFSNRVKNPYPGQIPTFLWTKAIEHGTEMTPAADRLKGVERLDTNIKMLVNLAGNSLINQHSDINDTIRILKDESRCEFILCSDIFMTPSARYADIFLPGTSVFEGNNIKAPWAGSNYLLRSNQVIEPLFGCRFEWEWLKEVAGKLGLYEAFIDGKPDAEQWLEENYQILKEMEPELPDYETFCRLGGWKYRDQRSVIALEKEIADPENHPFKTPSGKIEIFSKELYDMKQEDIPGIPRYISCPEGPDDPIKSKYPLQLIGWHTRRRCHSVHDNNEYQEEVEKPGLWIHPENAKERGIQGGELVDIFNDRGCVRIPAIVTKRIVQGVVAMSQGGWYTPDKYGTDVRGSINVLTSAAHPSPLAKGNPQHTNLVEVALADKRKYAMIDQISREF